MDHGSVFTSIRRLDGIVACGIMGHRSENSKLREFGILQILDCEIPNEFPKNNLRKVYAIEVNILHNLEMIFGDLKYRLTLFKSGTEKLTHLVYKYGDYYVIGTSKKSPDIFLSQIESVLANCNS